MNAVIGSAAVTAATGVRAWTEPTDSWSAAADRTPVPSFSTAPGTDCVSGSWLVDITGVGRLWAASALPRSRRAAASTTHDTADCTGANGAWPTNGFRSESNPSAVAATIAGAAGSAAAVTGSTLVTAVADCMTTDSVVAFSGADTLGSFSAAPAVSRRGVADVGGDTFVTGLGLLAGADTAVVVG